jgi:hypothetical protein
MESQQNRSNNAKYMEYVMHNFFLRRPVAGQEVLQTKSVNFVNLDSIAIAIAMDSHLCFVCGMCHPYTNSYLFGFTSNFYDLVYLFPLRK